MEFSVRAFKNNFEKPIVIKDEDFVKDLDSQKAFEENIVKNFKICPDSERSKYSDVIYRLNVKKMASVIMEQMYNPIVINAVSCILSALSTPDDSSLSRLRIRHWLNSGSSIGSGADGIVVAPNFKGTELFYQKSASNTNIDELAHEAVIGLKCLNKLRSQGIPNFVLVYNCFKCPPPVISEKNIISLCRDSENSVNYLLLEKISPIRGIKSFLTEDNDKEYTGVVLSLALALNEARKRFNYYHYDMHSENVLLREMPNLKDHYDSGVPYKFQVAYNFKDKNVYVRARYVPTIIDYGRSYAKIDGRVVKFIESRVFSKEEPLEIQDIYRWITNSGYESHGPRIRRTVYNMLLFFYPNLKYTELNILLKSMGDYYSIIPVTQESRKLTLEDFIDHVMNMKESQSIYSDEEYENLPYLQCEDKCSSRKDFLSKVIDNGKWDYFDFYEYINRKNIDLSEANVDFLEKYFPAKETKDWFNGLRNQYDEINLMLEKFTLSVYEISDEKYYQPVIFENVKRMITESIIIQTKIEALLDNIHITETILGSYPHPVIREKYRVYINDLNQSVKESIRSLSKINKGIEVNFKPLRQISIKDRHSKIGEWYKKYGKRMILAIQSEYSEDGIFSMV